MQFAITAAALTAVVAASDKVTTKFVTQTVSTLTLKQTYTPNAVVVGALATNGSVATNSTGASNSTGATNSTGAAPASNGTVVGSNSSASAKPSAPVAANGAVSSGIGAVAVVAAAALFL